MYNILVVDDDKEIVGAIEIYLKKEGYNILKAYNGNQALEKVKENEIHLIILDIMMPEKDGIETLEEIRKDKSIPVILLSAKSEDYDKIGGLNSGADDYITKPFNPLELIARVNSNLRRYVSLGSLENKDSKKTYKTGELIINDETKKVIVEGKEVKLTATEYNILKFLLENKGKVYSIPEIYENVWKEEGFGAENIIAVHIRHIREKIEINPKDPKYLKVIWGVGYKIENDFGDEGGNHQLE
ncbi:MAG: response regulator transcription factor [Clostridia bacterium]|nr:response regulator transcription factor [Clostridia bacterium]